MNSAGKKIAAFSLAVLLQLGLGAAVTEAAPGHASPPWIAQHSEQDKGRHGQDRMQQERRENERHEKEMKRRPNESRKQWKERQKQEKERHERTLRAIRVEHQRH